MAPLVFISYASADHDRARTILEDLESDGVSCWMASRDILGSEDYAKVIPPAIAGARVLLLVLSHASIASKHVYREVHLGIDDNKQILPVLVDPIGSVEGDLKFPLAGIQWVDATPRLEAALPKIRSEVRRLLAINGSIVRPPGRTPFERALASVFAWSLVAALTGLTLKLIQIHWMNLVPWPDVLLEVTRHPITLAAAVVLPLAAIGAQFALHRRLQSVLTLNALFATAPKAAAARTALALGLLAVLVVLVAFGPPTILFAKTTRTPESWQGIQVSRRDECPRTFYEVSTQYYEATVRIGRFNPSGDYALRINLEYGDPDSVNFCDMWGSAPIIQGESSSLEPQSGDTLRHTRIRFIEVRRPKDAFGASTRFAVTLIHPQRAPPQKSVEGIATVGRAGQSPWSSGPVPILAADWSR